MMRTERGPDDGAGNSTDDGPQSVAIVGGGIAGLATAALLAHDGFDVDLYERGQLGGRAGSWSSEGFRFDTGPSWYLMPEVFQRFFEQLGTSAEDYLQLIQLQPAYRIFFEDHACPVEISHRISANLRLFEEIESGAGRRLARYVRSAQHTYDMALRHFLYTSFTSARDLLSWEVLAAIPRLVPLLLQSMEGRIEQRFHDVRLRQILGYPAVLLGTSPDRAPSLYHLMSALDLTGGVLYPLGGFTTLIDAIAQLARQAGARLHTDCEVTSISTQRNTAPTTQGRRRFARANGVTVRADRNDSARFHPADFVVATADLHHVEHDLLPPDLRTHTNKWWQRHDVGPSGVLVYLGVRGKTPQLSHHSLCFTRDWRSNFGDINAGRIPRPASVYVCAPSRTDPSVAPPGDENLFLLIPMPADTHIGHGGIDRGGSAAVERIADDAIALVSDYAGIDDLVERIQVRRTVGPADFEDSFHAWNGSMLGPAHTLRQSAFFRPKNASETVEGVYYAGSQTTPGIGLPMCLISAQNVRQRIRRERSPSS